MGEDDDDTTTQPSNMFSGGGGREGPGSGRGTHETDDGERQRTHTNKTSSGSNNDPSSPTSAASHDRIGSTSTTTSRPEGYPSWLPRRPAGPAPAGSSVGERTRPGTAAGTWVDSPYDVGAGLELDDGGTLELGEYGDARRAGEEGDGDRDEEEETMEGPIAGPSTSLGGGERKATPRAVRIVRVPGGGVHQHHVQPSAAVTAMGESREASDSTRVPSASYPGVANVARTSPVQPLSPTVVNTFRSSAPIPASSAAPRRVRHSLPPNAPLPPPAVVSQSQYNNHRSSFYPQQPHAPQPPRFRARKFHPTLLRKESVAGRVAWYLWCIFVAFGGLVLQTFLDFNVAYMLGQILKHPSASQTTHDWTLALVAYVACWFLWVFGVWLMYEVVYSFWRRWRAKRPLLTPIYLSSAAYTFVCMTSYTNYCFLRHLRWSGLYVPMEDDANLDHAPEPSHQDRVREKRDGESIGEGDDEKRASRMRGGADAKEDTFDEDDGQQHNERRTSQPQSTPLPPNHRRSISQAQTQTSSSKQNGRSFSLSEGRPAISELASSERSESREQQRMPPGHIDLSDPMEPVPIAAGQEGAGPGAQQGRASGEKNKRFPSFSSPLPSPAQIKSRFLEQFTNTTPSSGNGTSRAIGTKTSPLNGGASQNHPSPKASGPKWSYDLNQFAAESCWMYSQNAPTVVLLLPRMGIALALYIATRSSTSAVGVAGLGRDSTWFSGGGQGLTTYGDCVLWFVMLWGLWRVVLLIVSWLGLWAYSGMACAGICGPRYRWEEISFDEDREHNGPGYPQDDHPHHHNYARQQRYSQQPPSTADPFLASITPMAPLPQPQPTRSRMSAYSAAESSYVPGGGRGARFRNPDDHKLNWPWMERCVDRIAEVWEECVVVDQRRPFGAGVGMRGLGIGSGREGHDDDDGDDEERVTRKDQQMGPAAAAPHMKGRASSGSPAAYRGFPGGGQQGYGYDSHYAPLDGTVLSTLPEVSSTNNTPSAVPTAPSMPIPAAVVPETSEPPLVLPIFSAGGSKRVPLTKDLFIAPDQVTAPSPSGSESWLGSSAVPLSFPVAAVTTTVPVFTYPVLSAQQLQVKPSSASQSQLSLSPIKNQSASRTPSYRPSNTSRTPTPLPFPLTTGPTGTPERAGAEHMFPTPATTVSLLPFPFQQGGTAPPDDSPTDDVVAPHVEEGQSGELSPRSPYDEEVGYPPSHAGSAGAATGSMSSLGQPIQSLYHLGGAPRHTPGSGRGSSASGSSPMGGLGSRPASGSHHHLPHYGQRTPSLSMSGGSGSGSAPPSAYGAAAARVRSRSDLSGSVEAYDDDYVYDDDEGSQLSSPIEAGIAGVGAGGGMGPRRSLVNIIAQQHPVIAPPPRRQGSSLSSGRRRAGTLPAPASPLHLDTAEHPHRPTHARGPSSDASASGSFRSRVASVPAPASPGLRGFFSPNPPSDDGHDDEEDEGSQEAAERDDSVGLLSPSSRAPSRRTSLVGMSLVRGRGSSFSLHHRWSDSHSNSSGPPRSRAGSFVPPVPRSRRSSDRSYSSMSETYNTPLSVAPDPAILARARDAAVGARAGQRMTDTSASRYTDARSSRVVSENSTSGSDSRDGLERNNNDHTFGVQVNWNIGEPQRGEHQGAARSISPRREIVDPPTIRQRTSTTSNLAGVRRQSLVHPRASPSSSNVDLASRSSRNGLPIDA